MQEVEHKIDGWICAMTVLMKDHFNKEATLLQEYFFDDLQSHSHCCTLCPVRAFIHYYYTGIKTAKCFICKKVFFLKFCLKLNQIERQENNPRSMFLRYYGEINRNQPKKYSRLRLLVFTIPLLYYHSATSVSF